MGATAGAVNNGLPTFGGPPPVNKPPSIFDVYNGALKTTGQNYDSLMGNYTDLFNSAKANPTQPISTTPVQPNLSFAPVSASTVTPSTTQYGQSSDTTNALGDLSGLASTGGYSASDIADIRARGVSPIRSVYANAQSDLNRQRTLQGGFSPGYTAATAKMARELSDSIANQVTNVNAQLAQNIASNKLSAAPAYASAASAEASRKSGIDESNTAALNAAAAENAAAANSASQFNSSGQLNTAEANAKIAQDNAANKLAVDQANQGIVGKNQQQLLDILKSAQSLYGTTPGLANTFGNQAIAANAQNIGVAEHNGVTPGVSTPAFNPFGIGAGVTNPLLNRTVAGR